MTTTAHAQHHLTTVITHWPDLQDALGTPNKVASFGVGLRAYLAALDRIDDQQAEAERQRARDLRLLERDPAQVGERPTPLRVAILDTMQAIHADLLECADAVAEVAQRQPMGQLPAGYPEADRARRAVLAMKDRHDPRRWKWTGPQPAAPYTALWLLGRVQGAPGPFHRLDVRQAELIAAVARSAAERIERALDISVERRTLDQRHEGCGGRIDVHGGEGKTPLAHCRLCGRIWAEGVVAA
ncbi:hypothetical protein ACFU96_27210 [Streptomyces sp. NPDC057620]|uniref:hypothetical protein n=1 Tax=Streptomyces sp. NPDC057620 TaxID=3346185 RepID=UPI0036A96041